MSLTYAEIAAFFREADVRIVGNRSLRVPQIDGHQATRIRLHLRSRHPGAAVQLPRPPRQAAAIRGGIDPKVRFHDLRHSYAAMLIAQGAHPRAIMERRGRAVRYDVVRPPSTQER